MITLVSRCPRFTELLGTKTVRILEDSRPANGPQRFRISVTEAALGEPAGAAQTRLFENTLRRISAP